MGLFKGIAAIQKKTYTVILLLILIVTIFLGYHAAKIQFESDISKEMPDTGEIFTKTLYFQESFPGSSTVLVAYSIDKELQKNPLDSVTEQEVVDSIYQLDGELRKLDKVTHVFSLGEIFKKARMVPMTQDIVDMVLSESKEHTSRLISSDKKATIVTIFTEELASKEDIDEFVNLVEDRIERSNPPYGIDVKVTGNPILRGDLQDYLVSDFYRTILIAILIIFPFIFLVTRKFSKAAMVMLPLLVGLVWYAGLVELLGFKLSVSTVATGAMVLGLGVEYSIFIYNKLEKAMEKVSVEEAVEEAVGFTGRAIFGSALTTTVAFISLGLSIVPMLSHLGIISSIGILAILFNCIFINPCIFLAIEKWTTKE
ncbi:MAG: MMPL family transporter [Candidatus Woesearchaeota archaeon]